MIDVTLHFAPDGAGIMVYPHAMIEAAERADQQTWRDRFDQALPERIGGDIERIAEVKIALVPWPTGFGMNTWVIAVTGAVRTKP